MELIRLVSAVLFVIFIVLKSFLLCAHGLSNVSVNSKRMTAIGVPIKILHEAEGHVVTLETTIGEVYRGKLVEVYVSLINCVSSERSN